MSGEMPELTPKEKAAIAALHKLAKTWPKTLWLYSASGTLWVMRKGPQGEQVSRSDSLGIDPSYSIGKPVNIDNDGGDW